MKVWKEKGMKAVEFKGFRFLISLGVLYVERWAPRLADWNPVGKMTVDREAVEGFRKVVELLEEET